MFVYFLLFFRFQRHFSVVDSEPAVCYEWCPGCSVQWIPSGQTGGREETEKQGGDRHPHKHQPLLHHTPQHRPNIVSTRGRGLVITVMITRTLNFG